MDTLATKQLELRGKGLIRGIRNISRSVLKRQLGRKFAPSERQEIYAYSYLIHMLGLLSQVTGTRTLSYQGLQVTSRTIQHAFLRLLSITDNAANIERLELSDLKQKKVNRENMIVAAQKYHIEEDVEGMSKILSRIQSRINRLSRNGVSDIGIKELWENAVKGLKVVFPDKGDRAESFASNYYVFSRHSSVAHMDIDLARKNIQGCELKFSNDRRMVLATMLNIMQFSGLYLFVINYWYNLNVEKRLKKWEVDMAVWKDALTNWVNGNREQ